MPDVNIRQNREMPYDSPFCRRGYSTIDGDFFTFRL